MEQKQGAPEQNVQGAERTGNTASAEQRKRLFSVIATVGLAAIVLGALGLWNSITAPFPARKEAATEVSTEEVEKELKARDTDQDTLSDFDEIFTHRTSVFVKDSDSDGIVDADEVAKGTNPNCPEGKTCGIADASETTELSADAATLRQTLKKSGAPSYILDQTDDKTILEQYQQVVIGNQNAGAGITESALENLSATQVRSLLKSNGVDEKTLNAIDDATLLQVYKNALAINP